MILFMANNGEPGDELNRVFGDGSVFDADDADLKRYLGHLSSEPVCNEKVRHRAIIRGLTINTIKTFRFMDAADRKNKKFTIIIIILSFVAVTVSSFSIWQSISKGI
jgi:hypothetical protein